MAYFLFKCWHEKLYFVTRKDFLPQKSTLAVDFVPITCDNSDLVCELRGKEYKQQFLHQLGLGDFGYYAFVEDKPVGYGWIKKKGSEDFFFTVEDGVAYLCRFFVHENYRGNGVYPAIITALVQSIEQIDRFYIAVERGNVASERGLKKTGFEFVKDFGFIRGFKHTFNKKSLK